MLQNFFTVLIIAFKLQYSTEVPLVHFAYQCQVKKSSERVLFIEYFFSKHDVTDGT